jgi:hypothetical protein
MIKKEPRKATEAQKQRIRQYAEVQLRKVEDIVCIGSRYRTSSIDQLYSYEAIDIISQLKTTVTQ